MVVQSRVRNQEHRNRVNTGTRSKIGRQVSNVLCGSCHFKEATAHAQFMFLDSAMSCLQAAMFKKSQHMLSSGLFFYAGNHNEFHDETQPAGIPDSKVLKFDAYFQEIVPISQQEHYRVRKVFIYYYLEDDSIAVIEPPIENAGMPQGTFIKRQRLPKNDNGETYHWKDLNVGININLYGRTFRVTSCDKFTKVFFESEGIELNPTEGIPSDPYTEFRKQPEHTFTTSTNFDKLKQFLTMDRRVLQFFSVWTDSDCVHSETWPVIIHYFLVDDTVEIREVHERNDGRDPFPVLMSRQRLPKTIKNVKDTFPICVLELSDQEVTEWYSPRDFIVGSYVTIMGRKFFLHDCDAYTKEFYAKNLGILGLTPVKMEKKVEEEVKPEIPPYNGFGLIEDSVQNCISLIPKPPKKDVMKLLKNQHKVLRYEVVLDTMYPEEKGRRFIMSYFLSDDMICIFEPKIRNSGFMEGQYLEKRKVPKPHSTSENPVYYGPEDFKIGSMVEVFGHRFIITNADEYVLNYIRAHKEKYPSDVLTSLENHFQHYAQQGSRTPSSSDLHKTPK